MWLFIIILIMTIYYYINYDYLVRILASDGMSFVGLCFLMLTWAWSKPDNVGHVCGFLRLFYKFILSVADFYLINLSLMVTTVPHTLVTITVKSNTM